MGWDVPRQQRVLRQAQAGRQHPQGKGSRWLRKALVESARATARSKDTYLAARCARPHRVACVADAGPKKAAVAVGHSILGIASYLLSRDVVYKDLGAEVLRPAGRRQKQAYTNRLVQQLEKLGFDVALIEAA